MSSTRVLFLVLIYIGLLHIMPGAGYAFPSLENRIANGCLDTGAATQRIQNNIWHAFITPVSEWLERDIDMASHAFHLFSIIEFLQSKFQSYTLTHTHTNISFKEDYQEMSHRLLEGLGHGCLSPNPLLLVETENVTHIIIQTAMRLLLSAYHLTSHFFSSKSEPPSPRQPLRASHMPHTYHYTYKKGQPFIKMFGCQQVSTPWIYIVDESLHETREGSQSHSFSFVILPEDCWLFPSHAYILVKNYTHEFVFTWDLALFPSFLNVNNRRLLFHTITHRSVTVSLSTSYIATVNKFYRG